MMSRILWALVIGFVLQVSVLSLRCTAQALDIAQQHEVDALTKQLEGQPNDSVSFAKRGNIFKKAGMWDKAAPDFEQALRLDPTWQQGYLYRALYCDLNGRYREAIKAINKAEDIGEVRPAAIALRGDIFLKLKDYKAAINDYDKAISLEPNDYMVYAARANAKLQFFGPSKDVENDLEKSISINPSFAFSRQLLESVRRKLKADSSIK
jgi:tetratricopeptide (TPR) repeat protein